MGRPVETELCLELGDVGSIQPPPTATLPGDLMAASPENRLVESTAVPWTCAMTCSMGPPGANCTITKLISSTPINVGIINSNRRAM